MEQRAIDMGLPITTADAIIGHLARYVSEIVDAKTSSSAQSLPPA